MWGRHEIFPLGMAEKHCVTPCAALQPSELAAWIEAALLALSFLPPNLQQHWVRSCSLQEGLKKAERCSGAGSVLGFASPARGMGLTSGTSGCRALITACVDLGLHFVTCWPCRGSMRFGLQTCGT